MEYYRRLARRGLHREVTEVRAPDAWYLKAGLSAPMLAAALVGRSLTGARHIGTTVTS